MNQERLESSLEGIRQLLSHLHGEVTTLEESYAQMLLVLRKLEGVCNVDDLTGLMRRNTFFKKWEQVLIECKELNKNCGILLIDIDHFKFVNDQHGHPTGDEVIRRVAGLLKQFESPDCFAGRFGGEEFVVAIRGTDAEVLGTAEMIRRRAERLHGPVLDAEGRPNTNPLVGSVQWKCTVSVGMASTRANSARSEESFNPSRLLHEADQALYVAKRKGRNQVRAA